MEKEEKGILTKLMRLMQLGYNNKDLIYLFFTDYLEYVIDIH